MSDGKRNNNNARSTIFRDIFAFACYRAVVVAHFLLRKVEQRTRINERPRATNEATAADCFCRHRLSLLGCFGWLGAAPKPHAGSSDGDRAIKRLSEVVTWSVLVWFARPKTDERLGLRRPCIFFGAADGLLCARGRRTSPCCYSGGPVSREWRISPRKQSTTICGLLRIQEHATSIWTNSKIE